MITATPTVFELFDEIDMLAKIEMFDEGGSNLTVKTVVAPANWPELSDAIFAALKLMHPAKGETHDQD